jgi:hypothetical protein
MQLLDVNTLDTMNNGVKVKIGGEIKMGRRKVAPKARLGPELLAITISNLILCNCGPCSNPSPKSLAIDDSNAY